MFRSGKRLHGSPRGWQTFDINRALRFIPAIYAYLVVTVLLVLLIGAVSVVDPMSLGGALWLGSTLLLAPVYSPGFLEPFGVGHVNGSLWTIPVEVSFYMIVPLLNDGSSVRRRGTAVAL